MSQLDPLLYSSVTLPADVLFLGGIEGQVADSGNQAINTQGHYGQPEICTGSAGVALGLKLSVVDDNAANPTQEEGQQKTNEILVIHDKVPFWLKILSIRQKYINKYRTDCQ